jgi:hypothetical protein
MAHTGASIPARHGVEPPVHRARPEPPARPVHPAHHHRLVVTTVAAAVLAAGLIGIDLRLARIDPAPVASSQMVSEALAAAAAAQAAYHDAHGTYTTDREQLGLADWLSTYDADVVLVTAGTDGFCIAAGPTGAAPVAWIDQDWKQLDKPCG